MAVGFCGGVAGEVSGGVGGGGSSQVGELLRGRGLRSAATCSREKTEKETNVLGFGHVRFLRVVR